MEEYQIDINTCPHELVFKYHTSHSKINSVDANYYCPMCKKSIGTNSADFFNKSSFKDSRIIELHSQIDANYGNLSKIRQEVLDNYDFYYDSSCTNEELAERMESTLKGVKEAYYVMILRKG